MPRADGLYYERHGAGDSLLLITGWTISAAVFEPVLDCYAEHFECIVYDRRGSARSKGSPPATMGALADDAAKLLTALGVPSAHVYGLSMGGMVAQEVALRHPGRVRGLVLGGTTPGARSRRGSGRRRSSRSRAAASRSAASARRCCSHRSSAASGPSASRS